MNAQDELMVWREQWQSGPAVPIQLLQRVERQTARMQMLRAAEIVVTIGIGGAVLAGAIFHPFLDRSYWLALATGTWAFIAAAWIVSARSTRRVWEAVELTTAGEVSLHVQRLQRQFQRILHGTILSVLFSVFVLIVAFAALDQVRATRGVRVGRSDVAMFWIVGGAVNLFVVLAQIGTWRKVHAELARMLELERQMKE